MRSIFDLIVSLWDITEYALANWIILGIMGPIVFVVAYKTTGETASAIGYNQKAMSIFHWIIRFIIYVVFVNILKVTIWIIAQPLIWFNVSDPRFISAIIVAILMFCLAIFIKAKTNVRHRIFWP